MKKANLLYHTFDGDLKRVTVTPCHLDTDCEFLMEIWEEEESPLKQSLQLCFDHVAAVEFSMNFFDQNVGSDLGGFYKVPSKKQKRKLLERVFKRRKKDWIMTRMQQDPDDPDNILNDHSGVDAMEKQLKQFNLYLLESMGGAWLVLARGYSCTVLDEWEVSRENETEKSGEAEA